MDLYVYKGSASISGDNINYIFEIQDYENYKEMGEAFIKKLNWIIEHDKKGTLQKELALEQEKFAKEGRRFLVKLGLVVVVIVVLYFVFKK